jgi:hypothetical protein
MSALWREFVKKTQIIYWAHLAPQYQEGHINLLNSSPKNLMVDLAKDRFNFNNGYTNCVALHEQLKNTFYVEFPFDMDIQVPKPNVFEGEKSWVISRERPDNFKNRSTVDIDLGWYFFSPESVNLEVFPPYAHKTETNKFAVMTYGSFNISQWFRPIRATHILWEGVKEFKAKEGEPIMYLRFDTDKPIIFKKFIATHNSC